MNYAILRFTSVITSFFLIFGCTGKVTNTSPEIPSIPGQPQLPKPVGVNVNHEPEVYLYGTTLQNSIILKGQIESNFGGIVVIDYTNLDTGGGPYNLGVDYTNRQDQGVTTFRTPRYIFDKDISKIRIRIQFFEFDEDQTESKSYFDLFFTPSFVDNKNNECINGSDAFWTKTKDLNDPGVVFLNNLYEETSSKFESIPITQEVENFVYRGCLSGESLKTKVLTKRGVSYNIEMLESSFGYSLRLEEIE